MDGLEHSARLQRDRPLSGEMTAYVDGEIFQLTAGECMYLPRRKPHALLITSDEVHCVVTITPGGFFDAINKMNAPAERMEVPTDLDTVTYANADLAETMKVFEQYGIRLLIPDEIHAEMPQYPVRPVRLDVQGSRENAIT